MSWMVSKESVQDRLAHLMERYVLRCTPEILTAYDLPPGAVSLVPHPIDRENVVGIVGFVGDLCGTLLLSIPADVAASRHPLRDDPAGVGRRMQFDWAGELANQLMGRIKLRLAEHGVNFRVHAPISLSGDRAHSVGALGQTCRATFGDRACEVQVWIDADIRNSRLWSEAFFEDREPGPTVEGTVIFL